MKRWSFDHLFYFTTLLGSSSQEERSAKDRWENSCRIFFTKKFFPKLFALPENVCSLALSILNPHPVPKDPFLKFYSARVPDLIIFYWSFLKTNQRFNFCGLILPLVKLHYFNPYTHCKQAPSYLNTLFPPWMTLHKDHFLICYCWIPPINSLQLWITLSIKDDITHHIS